MTTSLLRMKSLTRSSPGKSASRNHRSEFLTDRVRLRRDESFLHVTEERHVDEFAVTPWKLVFWQAGQVRLTLQPLQVIAVHCVAHGQFVNHCVAPSCRTALRVRNFSGIPAMSFWILSIRSGWNGLHHTSGPTSMMFTLLWYFSGIFAAM